MQDTTDTDLYSLSKSFLIQSMAETPLKWEAELHLLSQILPMSKHNSQDTKVDYRDGPKKIAIHFYHTLWMVCFDMNYQKVR